MPKDKEVTNLEQLLDRTGEAAEGEDQVSLDAILTEVGRRSFGPLLLLAGLITLAPVIGDIPGVPTIMGLIVFLVAAQLLVGREILWMPQWLLKRSVKREKLGDVQKWLRPPAKFLDRFLRPRLALFIEGSAVRIIALFCVAIAIAMPAMEVVPFSANAAGAGLTAFGLSLTAHDGLFALIAFVCTAITIGLVAYNLL
jgi:hypothetical protein